jgi:hypothetical protein
MDNNAFHDTTGALKLRPDMIRIGGRYDYRFIAAYMDGYLDKYRLHQIQVGTPVAPLMGPRQKHAVLLLPFGRKSFYHSLTLLKIDHKRLNPIEKGQKLQIKFYTAILLDDLANSLLHDGKAKSSRCKACECRGMRRT